MAYKYTSGLGNVGAFQVSGKPFVSGGIVPDGPTDDVQYELQFPQVTRWIEVRNKGTDLQAYADGGVRIGFSALSVMEAGTNYYELPASASTSRWELKCTSLFLSGSGECSVIAGCTGIPTGNIELNYSGSSGIG
jgi:hypothetical protein